MQKRRWSPKSSIKAKPINPGTCRLLSEQHTGSYVLLLQLQESGAIAEDARRTLDLVRGGRSFCCEALADLHP